MAKMQHGTVAPRTAESRGQSSRAKGQAQQTAAVDAPQSDEKRPVYRRQRASALPVRAPRSQS
ncbi:hypothetical protein CCMA1212_000670 [Trichoderma ghanense]|uniref:Uncharacterized protein n=1 Tax=Trichoderma ghanense TaxID=65468 RepID=A0ABY2HIV0_9HYPO